MNVKLSARMIKDDLELIKSSLKDEDVEIPSFWDACKPGFPAIAFILSLQAIVMFYGSKMPKEELCFSVFFSFLLCFFVFVSVTSASAHYKSIPMGIRLKSLIFRYIKLRVRMYVILWATLSIIAALVIIAYDLPPVAMPGASMIFIVFLYITFNSDMSHYNLSALSAAIATWREQSPKV